MSEELKLLYTYYLCWDWFTFTQQREGDDVLITVHSNLNRTPSEAFILRLTPNV